MFENLIKPKPNFYNLDRILSKNARYNVIFGGRGNGKSYAVLKEGVKRFVENEKQMVIIRRWERDFTGGRGSKMFSNLVSNGEISKLINGEWTGVYYFASKWYLCKEDPNNAEKIIKAPKPFCYAMAISQMEHDKSTSYPDVEIVLFDEFIAKEVYLPDEFVLFCNVLSTVIRHRDDVQIFMCGNTVNKYCPYFEEMGLTHVREMQQGTIDVYEYGDSGLTVAVEYCDTIKKNGFKGSDVYFAFNNPKLNMITGGDWELEIYPHLVNKYRPIDVLADAYIEFDGNSVKIEIISRDDELYIYFTRKTTPIKKPDEDIIFSLISDPRRNWITNIKKSNFKICGVILKLMAEGKAFYQDNEIGEVVRNWLNQQ